MDFYRINEEYNQYLQKYEKENRGVTKVPNIRYTDRNKFAFGAVMQVHGMNYFFSGKSIGVDRPLFMVQRFSCSEDRRDKKGNRAAPGIRVLLLCSGG